MTDGDFLNRLENFLCEKELLSTFSSRVAVGYFAKYLEADPQSMRHILPYYSANVSNKRIAPCADAQGGCPGIVPGLRAKPFWNDLEKFSWVQKLEDSFQDIKEEFINLRASTSGGFQPYRAPPSGDKRKFVDLLGEVATKTGEWNVCYLYLHGMDFEMNRKACPITSMLIQ